MKTLTIGKSPQCDIVIGNEYVSRVHAEISIVGNQYVYYDRSKNGSSINGRVINNERVTIAPGTPVLLANRVPLPWTQIYVMLPMHGVEIGVSNTQLDPRSVDNGDIYRPVKSNVPAWVYIISFIIPLVGWILYFAWKDEDYQKAKTASTWAWIGFGFNLLCIIAANA